MADYGYSAADYSLPTNDSPSNTGKNRQLPKRNSGRRSWFSDQPMSFEIAVEPVQENLENEVEYLELTHFSAQPKIDFGNLKVGKTISRTLIVHNPHDYTQFVVVEKFPTKKDFFLDLVEFTVEPNATVHMTLTWKPQDEMRCREMVIFRVDSAYRLQAILLGNAEQPLKPRKHRGLNVPNRGRRLGSVNTTPGLRQVLGEKSLNQSLTENSSMSAAKTPAKAAKSCELLPAEIMMPGVAKLLVRQDPSLNELPDTPTRRATFIKDDPVFADVPSKQITYYKNSPDRADTPVRRSTFLKDEPRFPVQSGACLLDAEHDQFIESPLRRTTFQKDDPNLPLTPVRRETYLKHSPAIKHSPRRPTIDDLTGAARRLSSIVGENEDEFDDFVVDFSRSSNLRRSLTYTKLNVSQSPKSHGSPASPDYKMEGPMRHVEQRDDVNSNISPTSSQYFTPLTTPLETPLGSDSEADDGQFEDSVMFLPGHEPMTPDAGDSTVITYSLCENEQNVTIENQVHEYVDEITEYKMTEIKTIQYETVITDENGRVIESNVENNKIQESELGFSRTVTLSKRDDQQHFSNTQAQLNEFSRTVTLSKQDVQLEEHSQYSAESQFVCNPIETESYFGKGVGSKLNNYSRTVTLQGPTQSEFHKHLPHVNSEKIPLVESDPFSQTIGYRCTRPQWFMTENTDPLANGTSPGPKWLKEEYSFMPQEQSFNNEEHGNSSILDSSESKSRISNSLDSLSAQSKDSLDTDSVVSRSPKEAKPDEQSPEISSDKLKSSKIDNMLQCSPENELKVLPEDDEKSPRLMLEDVSFSHEHVIEELNSVKVELLQRLSSTPMVGPYGVFQRSMYNNPSPIAKCKAQDTVTKLKPSVPIPQQAIINALPRERESKRSLFRQSLQKSENISQLHGNQSSLHDQSSIHCHHHDKDHISLKSALEGHAGSISQTPQPTHVGVPLLLKHELSPSKKRPLSVERQNSLSRLTAPTESSKKKAKNDTGAIPKQPTNETPKATPSGAAIDRKLTRSMQLHRQAALKKSEAKSRKSPPIKAIRPSASRAANVSLIKKPALMKGVAQSKLTLLRTSKPTALPKHPMPFAAKNVYYDERWMEKQEKGFTMWLNFILTPPDEFTSTTSTQQKVDAVKLCIDVMSRDNIQRAPTKEVLSFRAYSAKRRMNRLRRSACMLFQSDSFITIIDKLEREVELNRIKVRKDRKIHVDVGIKQRLLDMLLCYNTLWLRVGLETIFGEIIPMQNNMDVMMLSRFIVTRMLGNPDIAQRYAHPTVPHLYKEGYDEELAKFILKKFLMLVLVLDRAKRSHLIDHDPCLFCKNSEYKASRDLLLNFSKDYLSGEGDLTKHLSYFGYTVHHNQTALEEFDFSVSNLAVDLRCGLRLTRVMELLTEQWQLSQQLRVPAISRLQKVHNVSLALKALTDRGIALVTSKGEELDSKMIVDGHREKTLQLLWLIIFNFQVDMLINTEQLREEISFLTKNLRYKKKLSKLLNNIENCSTPDRRTSMDPEMYNRSLNLGLLLKWCRAVCAHYGLAIENFTVSFSDGRALCCLLHHYHPSLLPVGQVNMETTLTYQDNLGNSTNDSDDDFNDWSTTFNQSTVKPEIFETLLTNEKENFKLLHNALVELGGVPMMIKSVDMSNTIPDEKVVITFVTYMCARLLDLRREVRAARVIQSAWRLYMLKKTTHLMQSRSKAASVIQSAIRRMLKRRRAERMLEAALVIQNFWRSVRSRRQTRELKKRALVQKQTRAATVIQKSVQKFLERKRQERFIRCVVSIQSILRGRSVRHALSAQNSAAGKIQRYWRLRKLAHKQRQLFLVQKTAAIRIQSMIRLFLIRRRLQKSNAACKIQSFYRMYSQRKQFLYLRKSVVFVTCKYRALKVRREFLSKRTAVVLIQQKFRAVREGRRCRENFLRMKNAVHVIEACMIRKLEKRRAQQNKAAGAIQAWFRNQVARKRLVKRQSSAVILQRFYRSRLLTRRAVLDYQTTRSSIITIQAHIRGFLVRCMMLRMQAAALSIQTVYRKSLCLKRFRLMKNAASSIQAWWRNLVLARNIRKEYVRTRVKVIKIQAIIRMGQARSDYVRKRNAAVLIQAFYRCHAGRRNYESLKGAAMVIQRRFRALTTMRQAREDYLIARRAIVTIQSAFRGLIVRRYVQKVKSIVMIQAHWKGHIQRVKYQQLKMAAVKIQSWTRCWNCQKAFSKKQKAACVIQRKWRATLLAQKQRCEFTKERNASIVIQAALRGYRQRILYQKQRNAAVQLQAAYRGYAARKHIYRMHAAALILQTYFRANQVMKKNQDEFKLMKSSCIALQSAWRGHVAKQRYVRIRSASLKIQTAWRMYSQRKEYLQLKKATLVIQERWRATLIARKLQCEFYVTLGAVICIQAAARTWKARKEYLQTYSAVVRIQSFVRGYLVRKQVGKMEAAALMIQKHFRANQAMKKAREIYISKRNAAIVVQAAFRRYILVKEFTAMKKGFVKLQALCRCRTMRTEFLKKCQAAVVLQTRYRAHLLKKKAREEYLITRKAVVMIQSAFRRQIILKEFNTMKNGFIKLQALYRCRATRAEFLRKCQAAVVIQTRYRAHVLHVNTMVNYHVLRGATITLQSAYRGAKARQYVKNIRAAILIQKHWRMFMERRRYQERKNAAIVIQGAIRRFLAHRDHVKKHSAAVAIQKWYRLLVLARSARRNYLIMIGAAITIQTAYRRMLCLRMHKRAMAATTIQKHWRMCVKRDEFSRWKKCAVCLQSRVRMVQAREKFLKQKQAVLSVQRRWRGILLHRRFVWQKETMNNSARLIQAFFRMKSQMRRYQTMRFGVIQMQALIRGRIQRRNYLLQQASAICIQRRLRGFIVRRKYQTMKQAAIIIQNKWRATLAMRKQRSYYCIMTGATIAIQACFKGYRQRKQYTKVRNAVMIIQRTFRGHHQKAEYLQLRNAVVTCQKAFRSKCVAVKTRQEFLQITTAVIRVQSFFRMCLIRRKFLKQRRDVIILQALIRGFLYRKSQNCRSRAAICIQRYWRATQLMIAVRNEYFMTIGAVITIQSRFRGYIEERRYLTIRRGITKLQALIRGRNQRQLYEKQKMAACLVQQFYRMCKKRRSYQMEYERTRAATLTLQAYFRGFLVRKSLRLNQAAVLIQKNWRCFQTRRNYLQLKASALVIQKLYRCRKAVQGYRRIKQAACTLQKYFRSEIARKRVRMDFLQKNTAVVHIQSMFRMYYERKKFLDMRTSCITVQRIYRGWLERRRYRVRVKEHRSAIIIQQAYRRLVQTSTKACLEREQYLHLLSSVKRIQQAARVYLARRQVAARTIQVAVRLFFARQAKRRRAAVIIQSLWRGYKLRCASKDKKINAARKRVQDATQNATEDKKLCNRTRSALDYLLQCKQLALVLECVMNLDVATRLSPKCCEWLVEEQAQNVLYQLIRGCNRSLPHMEIIKSTINIFINLAKYDKTRDSVYEVPDSIDTLVQLLSIYREKGLIFTKTCTLLGILCQDPTHKQEVLAMPKIVEKIQSIHFLTARKDKLEETRAITQSKLKASKTFGTAASLSHGHRLHPAWCARRDSLYQIDNPLLAINFVVTALGLSTK